MEIYIYIYNKRNHNSDLLFSINDIINDLKITCPVFILSGGHFNLIPDEWLNRDHSKLNFSQVNKIIALQGFWLIAGEIRMQGIFLF